MGHPDRGWGWLRVRLWLRPFLFLERERMNAKFTEIHAAADYMGPGAVEVPHYQSEITDLVRRRGVFGQRIKQVPATGHPSRFFEETAIPAATAASGFVDPRNIVAPLVTPTRVERSVPLKALVAQINYNLFDLELGQQQSRFAYLQAKDLTDTVDGVLRTHDVALWNGTDTSLSCLLYTSDAADDLLCVDLGGRCIIKKKN